MIKSPWFHKYKLTAIISLATLIAFAPTTLYLFHFNDGFSADQKDWAAFSTILSSGLTALALVFNAIMIARTIGHHHFLKNEDKYNGYRDALHKLKYFMQKRIEVFSTNDNEEKIIEEFTELCDAITRFRDYPFKASIYLDIERFTRWSSIQLLKLYISLDALIESAEFEEEELVDKNISVAKVFEEGITRTQKMIENLQIAVYK